MLSTGFLHFDAVGLNSAWMEWWPEASRVTNCIAKLSSILQQKEFEVKMEKSEAMAPKGRL